jgi:hypothetical protein
VVVTNTHTFGEIGIIVGAGEVIGSGIKVKDGVCICGGPGFPNRLSSGSMRFWARYWTSTLIRSVLDTQSFVRCARHHASPGEESVVNGIGRYEGVSVAKSNVNDDEVVNVVQVVSDLRSSKFSSSTTDDKVASGSIDDLVGYVTGYMELSICPADLEL